ncbi:MAG: biosynthetic-type acetolactate synthase large subunit [Paludibacteraceae bacterium]|nr:biosynthetic-type acetolactate synthase large subunit [Paludibacteraceae bacterium]
MSDPIKGSYILMESLLREGVDTIFGYPGGSIIPVFDALYDYMDKFNYLLMRHEQGAVHAAEGYARVSGKPGVCIVTSGPGATNTITGIGDAMMDSTPIIVITGQVGTASLGTDAFQEIDMVGITQPITKWACQIRSADEVADAVAKAFYISTTGRPGPVVLDFTKNAQNELAKFHHERCTYYRSYIPAPHVCPEQIKEAARLINEAQKPLAIVGQGVVLGNAENELLQFLEKADIPAASTLLGLSAMPTDFRLNKGFVGMHGNIAPNMKTNECDVLIAIGMRFDDRVTGNPNTYAQQAKIIHVDIDPAEIDKNVKTTAKVLGDAKETLAALTQAINPARHEAWIQSFEPYEQKEQETVIEKELHHEGERITMSEIVRNVSDATQREAVLVTDVGQNQMASARYFQYKHTRSIVTSGGLGTMGFGIPAAIGAKVGAPERIVCLFVGDGGFQMTIEELGTIMQSNIGVKMILLNNNYLGMVRQWQELFFHKRYSSTAMANPDFNLIANAYHIANRRVSNRSEMDEAIQDMLKDDQAYLLVVDVEENGLIYPMIPAGETVTNILTPKV